jgi:hypothetical protein
MRSIFAPVLGLILVGLVSGCAVSSQPKAMISVPTGEVHRSKETVSVVVTGGKETSSGGVSQISSKDFGQALRDSIEQSRLFSKALDTADGTYRLSAYIGELAQPFIGFDMTVTLEVGYTLADTRSQKSIWKKSIRSTYTATTKDSIVGATRLQMANEGAARKNIEEAISAISKLNLE